PRRHRFADAEIGVGDVRIGRRRRRLLLDARGGLLAGGTRRLELGARRGDLGFAPDALLGAAHLRLRLRQLRGVAVARRARRIEARLRDEALRAQALLLAQRLLGQRERRARG